MRRAGVVVAWGLLSALGCGGKADIDVSRRSSVEPLPPGSMLPDAGVKDAGGEPTPAPDRQPPTPAPFADPGCVPVSAPPARKECDPLASPSGCPDGRSCFPFVDYPSSPCEVERFGTLCALAGPGTQGDSCDQQGCAADHICVSTGRGTQCVRLCALAAGAPNVCPAGLLCLPVDIQGFGGCL
jgi:hypothetical protein